MDEYLGIVKAALDMGIKPRCHMEDVTRADIYGFCVPFAIELMKLREESGVDIKIRLCDTMGYGVPYPGAALPRSVPKLVRAMIDDAGVPGHLLEWHGHNDFHKVLVNSVTAWLYGCGAVNGALLGFGERTGNAPIEGMLIEYISLRGTTDGIDTTVISEIGEYFERELHYNIPASYPFVGKNFNNTSAGIHADGLLKNEEIYNAFDTGKILNRPIRITITDKSGKAGIVHWLNSRLKLEGERAVDKNHPGVAKIFKRIMEMYEYRTLHHHLRRRDGKHGPPVPLRALCLGIRPAQAEGLQAGGPPGRRPGPVGRDPLHGPGPDGAGPPEGPGQLPLHPVHVCRQPGRAQDHPEHHPHRGPGQVRRDETG